MPKKTKVAPMTASELRQVALLRSDPRITEVVENMLVLRMTPGTIIAKLHKDFQIDPAMAQQFISSVLRQWSKTQEKNRKTRKAHMRATLDAFYTKALSQGKLSAAVQALRELIRLDGLAEPEELRIDVKAMEVDDAIAYIEQAHELVSLAKNRGIIEATATEVTPSDMGSGGSDGGDTH